MSGNGMIYLISFIILMGGLIYMIFLSNEMSVILERLSKRTKRLMNKVEKISKETDTDKD
tara:strand:+ start:225 stop:404 length:180 start_codon:yes stop_codon:yes gene_type:complete